jgi:large subunit ribosomal protein L2
MALKTYKPITPGLRQLVKVDRSGLHKGGPVKALARGLAKSGGRNNLGRATNWLMGGGHKRSYRIVDFKRRKFDMPAKVERVEYDPTASSPISLPRRGWRRVTR